jgi:ABC-type sugar transport system substrate-binding protein
MFNSEQTKFIKMRGMDMITKRTVFTTVFALLLAAMLMSACQPAATAAPTQPPAAASTQPPAAPAATTQVSASPAASSGGPTSDWPIAQKVRMCWITNLGNPYGVAKTDLGKKEAALFGYTLDVYDLKDIPTEISAIEDCTAKKYDVIILTPYDKTALDSAMQKARTAGIYVISEGADLDAQGLAIVNTQIGSDGTLEGTAAGQLICQALPNGGNWVMIEGATGHPLVPLRGGVAVKWVQDHCPTAILLDHQTGNWDPALSRTVMENFLTAYPNKINLVYCHDGSECMGAEQAIVAANIPTGQIKIIGINGNKAEYAAIKAGRWYGTILNDASWISINAVQRSRDLVEHRPILKLYVSPADKITKDNVDLYTPWW